MSAVEMTTCPSCSGRRTVTAMVDGYRDGKRFGEMRELACLTCGGKGSITTFHAEQIAEGKRRRDDRVARGMSLREEAKRLGIDPSELNDIEHGRGLNLRSVFEPFSKVVV